MNENWFRDDKIIFFFFLKKNFMASRYVCYFNKYFNLQARKAVHLKCHVEHVDQLRRVLDI